MKDFIWYFGFIHIIFYTGLGLVCIFRPWILAIIDAWKEKPINQKIADFKKY